MSDYLDRPVYDDVEDEARRDRDRHDLVVDERPTRREIEAEERGY